MVDSDEKKCVGGCEYWGGVGGACGSGVVGGGDY